MLECEPYSHRSFAEVGELTYPHVLWLLRGGEMPTPHRRHFRSMEEAWQYALATAPPPPHPGPATNGNGAAPVRPEDPKIS
jgi:hypothetical protein